MFKELNSKIYECGGGVRDSLLGIDPKDIDYVCVETSAEEFERILPEAKLVGKSFPVYLLNGYEVALARTETPKETESNNQYTNFDVVVGVTLEEDAVRRDLTINALYCNYLTREIVDPFNGRLDLKKGLLRACSLDSFSNDPLRILRLARFAARYDFKIEEKTFKLACNASGGLKKITPDRIYIELQKVYSECEKPSLFFEILESFGALKYHFKPLYLAIRMPAGKPEYHPSTRSPLSGYRCNTVFQHTMDCIDRCKSKGYSFSVFLAVLNHDNGKVITKRNPDVNMQSHIGHDIRSYIINKQLIKQNRFTCFENELVVSFARYHMTFHNLEKIRKPIKLIRFFRKIKRFHDTIINAADCDSPLTEAQYKILEDLKYVFKNTEIIIPYELLGTDKVEEYVNSLYAQSYKKKSKCNYL